MGAHPMFVLIHSPLLGPYSWGLVADALRTRGNDVVVPPIRSLEHEGPPYWQRHLEAISRAIESQQVDDVIVVGHSGAGRLLPVAARNASVNVAAYIFVDSDIPTRTESRLDAMPQEMAQQFRDAAEDGLLPGWPEEVFEDEIKDDQVRKRLVSELSPLPLEVYEERIPLPSEWPDAKCAYIRLSDSYPDSETHAIQQGWPMRRLEGGHFLLLSSPTDVATALIEVTTVRCSGRRSPDRASSHSLAPAATSWGEASDLEALR